MKSFLLRSAVFLLVSAGLYAAIVCTYYVREGDLAVVIDRQNNAIIQAHSEGFIWVMDAFWPERVDVRRVRAKGVFDRFVEIPAPGLQDLSEERYMIRVPVYCSYMVTPQAVPYVRSLPDASEIFTGLIEERLRIALSSLVNSNQIPYNPEMAAKLVTDQANDAFSQAAAALAERGINVENLRLQDGLICPDMVSYRRGLEYQEQLLRLTEQQELVRRRFEQQLQLSRLEADEYRNRLTALQEMLKQSPEILKFIYIDKLAGHKELLPPVAASGYPLGIEVKENEQNAVPAGDLDNFRR